MSEIINNDPCGNIAYSKMIACGFHPQEATAAIEEVLEELEKPQEEAVEEKPVEEAPVEEEKPAEEPKEEAPEEKPEEEAKEEEKPAEEESKEEESKEEEPKAVDEEKAELKSRVEALEKKLEELQSKGKGKKIDREVVNARPTVEGSAEHKEVESGPLTVEEGLRALYKR